MTQFLAMSALAAALFGAVADDARADDVRADDVRADDAAGAKAEILSAFYGLDGSPRIRRAGFLACRRVTGRDGMPVIFSTEIDADTLDADDFRVATASGAIGRVDCVTLRPADEKGEKRTALLIGEFGSPDDQAAKVEIVGDIASLDGSLNFRGAETDVIPLEAGPTLILAETLAREDWSLGESGDCPRDGVKTIVRAVWTGGVTKPGGAEIDDTERLLYRVSVTLADGTVATVTPIALGDLNDSDNNHDLCLDVEGAPTRVFFAAGALTDPNEDLNPDTEVAVAADRP